MIRAARPMTAVLGLGLMALAGCARGTVQDALGMGKRAPDEFAVVARAPLILPPDFELRPPRPGEARPASTTSDQARATLLGQPMAAADVSAAADVPAAAGERPQSAPAERPQSAPASAGQQALLVEAGGAAADPEVRRRIAEENQSLAAVEEELFTRMLRWREPSALAATVDANAETERLRANRAAGQPVTAGETPTVVERRQSPLGALLERVF